MKRSLTKAGSIINIILSVISTFFYGYASFAMYIVVAIAHDIDSQAQETSQLIAMFIVMMAIAVLSIVTIVLSAIAIKKSKLSIHEFNRRKGSVVALFICTMILAGLHVYYIIGSELAFFSIINTIMFSITSLFVLIDLCKNKKALKNAPVEEIMDQPAKQPVEAQPTQVKPEENIEDRLIKINNLKAQGLITEDEYNKLKQDKILEFATTLGEAIELMSSYITISELSVEMKAVLLEMEKR